MLRNPLVCFLKQKGEALSSRQWEGGSCPSHTAQGSSWDRGMWVCKAQGRTTLGQQLPASPWGCKEAPRPQCHEDNMSSPGPQWQRQLPWPRGQRPGFCGSLPALQRPLPSPPQAVLHGATPAPLSLQAADTHLASPPALTQHFCTFTAVSAPSLAALWHTNHGLIQLPLGHLLPHSTALPVTFLPPDNQSPLPHLHLVALFFFLCCFFPLLWKLYHLRNCPSSRDPNLLFFMWSCT